MKQGDKVKIISAPKVDNNEYGQMHINKSVGRIGTISKIYGYGTRNVYVTFESFNYNYYAMENLELITP